MTKTKYGNFINQVNEQGYCNKWNIDINEFIDILFMEDGKKAILICKKNNIDVITFSLSTLFNIRSSFSANFNTTNENIKLKINLNNNQKQQFVNINKFNDILLENTELKISFIINKEIKKGDILAIIDNVEVVFNVQENVNFVCDIIS